MEGYSLGSKSGSGIPDGISIIPSDFGGVWERSYQGNFKSPLTGYTIGLPDPITDQDTILTALGKLEAGNSAGLRGSGTLDKLAKFTPDGNTLGDSIFSDDGVDGTVDGKLQILGGLETNKITGTVTNMGMDDAGHLTPKVVVESIQQGSGVVVNNDDPQKPVISAVPQTAVGVSENLFFTADTINVAGMDFLRVSETDKGTTPEEIEVVNVNDDEKKFFAKDLLTDIYTAERFFAAGSYNANLTVSANSNAALKRFTVEIYAANADGVPFENPDTNAPVGDLGVRVLTVLTSSASTIESNDVVQFTLSGTVQTPLRLSAGGRLRFHVSGEKVGVQGGAFDVEVRYGNANNSYASFPQATTSSTVINVTPIAGATVSDALVALKAGSASLDASSEENYVPKFLGVDKALGNSQIFDDGVHVLVGEKTPEDPTAQLEVTGRISQVIPRFCTFFGRETGQNDTSDGSVGVGFASLKNNIGAFSVGVGYLAMKENKGGNATGIGYQAMEYNKGADSTGIGHLVMENNTGRNANAMGHSAGLNNTGDSLNVLGAFSATFNEGRNVTIVGHNSLTTFRPDTSKVQTITAVDVTNNEITIPNHGLGNAGKRVNLFYESTGGNIGGLTNPDTELFEIIDANTIQLVGRHISGPGNGVQTMTPQLPAFNDVIIVGNNIEPTKSGQTIIGSSNTVETVLKGVVNIATLGTASGAVTNIGVDANGDVVAGASGGGASGTLNRMAKFTPDGSTLGDSRLIDDGTSAWFNNQNSSVFFGEEAGLSSDLNDRGATAIGTRAGRDNVAGFNWTAIGSEAGEKDVTGSNWVAVGHNAARRNVDGTFAEEFTNGVYLGSGTKVGGTGVSNEIVIGFQADGAGSNTVVLGNNQIATTLLKGQVLIGETSSTDTTSQLEINGRVSQILPNFETMFGKDAGKNNTASGSTGFGNKCFRVQYWDILKWFWI